MVERSKRTIGALELSAMPMAGVGEPSAVPWLAWAIFISYFSGFLMASCTYIYNEKNVRR